MCWYKIESKDILLSLQKYFIVLLTMFTFSQQIVGGNISENIKEEFEKIKQNQICSCCINFQDSDMQFAMVLSQANKELNRTNEDLNRTNEELNRTNEELKKTNEEQQRQLEEEKKEVIEILEELREMEDKKNENEKKLEKKLEQKDEIIKNHKNEKDQILNKNKDLDGQLKETLNELKELNEKDKKNEEKLKENEEIINGLENDKKQLEETCNKLKKLNEKYNEDEKKYKENDKKIKEYESKINKYENEINQISIENKNLNEQIKNFSSNVNDVDLMKFQQKADENKSREIFNIFSDNTPGQPLTDTGIFYLPFKFLGDETSKTHIRYLESGIKGNFLKNSKEKNSWENNKKREFKGKGGNTPTKNDYTYKKIPNNQNSNNTRNDLNKTTQNNMKKKCFIKEKTYGNLLSNKNSFSISEKTEENNEVIKIRNNEFYLKANSDFPGGYKVLSLGNLNKIIFSRYSVEKRIECPTVNIDTLKKLYLINEGATWIRKEEEKNNKEGKKNKEVKNNKDENSYIIKTTISNLTGLSMVEFSKCFYNPDEKISIACSNVQNSNEQNSNVQKANVQNMDIDDDTMKKINLNYKDYIKFVDIDQYLIAKDKKKYFLLKLDLKDPECIALLQQVGKGNYGVVKKALIFENNRYVPKAIKFTCANSEYENATKENIEKEIFAGRVARLVDPDNIAYVQNYMTIDKFISRKNDTEEEKISLSEVWDEYLSKERYEKFQEDKQNIKKCFENNVFNGNNNISGPLYIMIMDLIDGDDLFKNRNTININDLGDILSKVLINCSSKVALNDIKAKNIIFNRRKNKFSIIDIQTLEKTTSDLSDPLGTPEYWPFFKTLNINFENLKNVEEDNLLNIYCNTIDNNFVDTYAACMTMYFTKFHTFTAAGLLTLLLKWIVLEEENKGKKGWKNFSLKKKIMFLQNYKDNYEKYINFVYGDKEPIIKDLENSFNLNYEKDDFDDNAINEINTEGDDYSDIRFFFENIDDRNLNNNQKNKLAGLLKKVIEFEKESDIFYLLGEIKEQIKASKEIELKEEKSKQIISFYKKRVKEDFDNFAKLSDSNCRYDDFIKYILCFGSCLNYNNSKNISNTGKFLETIELKEKFEEKEEKFFIEKNNIEETINDLVSGFNQKFINDLLEIFPLDKYYKISKTFINDKQMLEHNLKKLFPDLKEKKDDLNKKMKVFYLLHLLEKQNALHVPRNFVKSFSLIKDKKDNKIK